MTRQLGIQNQENKFGIPLTLNEHIQQVIQMCHVHKDLPC